MLGGCLGNTAGMCTSSWAFSRVGWAARVTALAAVLAVMLAAGSLRAQSAPPGQDMHTPEPAASQPAAPLLNAPAAGERSAEPVAERSADMSSERSARMGAWLANLSQIESIGRITGGIWDLVLGGAEIGIGVAVAFPSAASSRGPERAALSALFIGLGAGMFAGAIVTLARPQIDAERYARWQTLRTLDALTLARFEGELAAGAASAHQRRIYGSMASFGLALGGAAVLSLTPLTRLKDGAAELAYALGAAYAVVGVVEGILSLVFESPRERAYRLYRLGQGPEAAHNTVRVAPFYAALGGGLALRAAF
jgi:hypothetical protein